ncbi:MAG: DUF922 domain-containing protein [Sulfitobacter sp.]
MKVNLQIASPKTIFYPVKGKDYTEAATYLIEKPYSACYEANPTYKTKYSDGTTTEITIKAKPTITLPKWNGASKLKGDEKKYWTSMMTALKKHEARHHKYFVDAAKKFKKSRESDGDVPNDDVAKVMNAFFTAGQAEQDAYDNRTDHGVSEGVVLPI